MPSRAFRFYVGFIIATSVVIVSSVVAILSAARALEHSGTLDSLTVHKIRVVDNDGTLRLLIANQEGFPSEGLIHGKPLNPHSRSVGSAASLFFYNRDGSEQGALRWDGRQKSGTNASPFQYGALTLDQLEANDNLVLSYGEQDGKHGADLSGFQQPQTTPLDTLLMQYDTVGHTTTDSLAKRRAREAFRHAHFDGHLRFRIGYDQERSEVVLGDAQGRPRLVMTVGADGTPKIQFLDESGKVVRELTGAESGTR